MALLLTTMKSIKWSQTGSAVARLITLQRSLMKGQFLQLPFLGSRVVIMAEKAMNQILCMTRQWPLYLKVARRQYPQCSVS